MLPILLLVFACTSYQASAFTLTAIPTQYNGAINLIINLTMSAGEEEVTSYLHFFIDYLPSGIFLPFQMDRIILNSATLIKPSKKAANPINDISKWVIYQEVHSNSYYIWIDPGKENTINFFTDDDNKCLVLNVI